MPTYTFIDTRTEERVTHSMSAREYDQFLIDNPHLKFHWNPSTVPSTVSGVNQKPDSGFRDVLKTIKKGNPGSNINTF